MLHAICKNLGSNFGTSIFIYFKDEISVTKLVDKIDHGQPSIVVQYLTFV
jgi:hypothetical protein